MADLVCLCARGPLTLTLSPLGRGDVPYDALESPETVRQIPFAPAGRRWPEGSDEGATGDEL